MTLQEDRIRALQQRTEIPDGGFAGTFLTKNSDADGDLIWTSGPDSQVLIGNGDPNGVLNAAKGTPYVDRTGPAFWLNSDGLTAWDAVSGDSFWQYGVTTATTLDLNTTTTAGITEARIDAPIVMLRSDVAGESDAFTSIDADSGSGSDWASAAETDSGGTFGGASAAIGGHAGTHGQVTVGANESDGDGRFVEVIFYGTGAIIQSGLNVVPDSAVMAAGDFGIWLDDTNGASKLMIKAKQANGTVVTGSVTLS